MILYQYRCKNKKCLHEFEEFNTPKQTVKIKCPKCHSKNVQRVIKTQKFRLVGKGFYSGHQGKKLA